MSHWRGPDEIQARLRGPVNPLPTKFTPDGEIDPDGMRSTIDVSLDAGVEVIMLTWGEGLVSLLTDDEVAEIHRIVIDHVGRRAVTIACDAMWGLNKAREFAAYVDELGFDLYMARPAEWARGTPESLADWYRGVAQETRVMFVGDVPLRTCELVEDEPNLLAFKEDIDLAYAHEVLMRWGDRWPMTGGGGMKRHHLLWPHGCRSWLDVFVRSYPGAGNDLLGRVATGRYRHGLGDHRAIRACDRTVGGGVSGWRQRILRLDGRSARCVAALATLPRAEPHRRGDCRAAPGPACAESGLMPVAGDSRVTRK